jgi:hypothetical protein
VDRLNGLPKYVVFTTLEEPKWTNATVLRGDPVILTVGVLRAGTKFNIIPDNASLEATVRTFSVEQAKEIQAQATLLCTEIPPVTASGPRWTSITCTRPRTTRRQKPHG